MIATRDLVRQGMPIVDAVAKSLARRLSGVVLFEDLRSIGQMALLQVARGFDRDRSTFVAYAAPRLKWAMLDGVRRETHGRSTTARVLAVIASERFADGGGLPEGPASYDADEGALEALLDGHAAAMALGLAAAPQGGPSEGPEALFLRAEERQRIRAAVRALPERERVLIERHYFEDEAFQVVAADLGITKSWASRLHHQAVEALSHALRG